MKGIVDIVMATHAGMTSDEFDANRAATGLPPRSIRVWKRLVSRDRFRADDRAVGLSARQWLSGPISSPAVEWNSCAPLPRTLWHPPRADHRLDHQDGIQDRRWRAGAGQAAGDRLHRRRSGQAGRDRQVPRACARSWRSAIPTAICRCCNTWLPETGHALWQSCITTMATREVAYDRGSHVGALDKALDYAQEQRLVAHQHERMTSGRSSATEPAAVHPALVSTASAARLALVLYLPVKFCKNSDN